MGEILGSIKAVLSKTGPNDESECLEEIRRSLPKWVKEMTELIVQSPSSLDRKNATAVFSFVENLCQNEARLFEGVPIGDLFVRLLWYFCDRDYEWFVFFFLLIVSSPILLSLLFFFFPCRLQSFLSPSHFSCAISITGFLGQWGR